jgi:ribonucleotide reductase beta subunit family protein with ferritin-like domain
MASTTTPQQQEVLLSEEGNRFVLFPIKYNDIWQLYKTAASVFWVPNEVDLTKDIDDWNNVLNEDEKYFIKNVLAFFSSSDSIVNENLAARFLNEVQVSEAKAFYGFQIAMEVIHQEMYSLMIDTYVKDTEEKNALFNSIFTVPTITKKAQWALHWIKDQEASFATRLIAFAIVEGIFFSSAFASIYWLKERGLMPGLCLSNEFISRDEGLHCEFAILLYSYIANKLPQETVHAIVSEATEIECEFVEDSLRVKLIGMNSDLMCDYVKFCSDRLLQQLGYDKLYNVQNPFPFMERIGLSNKTNFFEHYVADYSKANVGKTDAFVFSTEEDF